MSIAAACPSHPDQPASDACCRCGGYACPQCLSSGERSAPLCTACDAQLAAEHGVHVAAAARVVVGSLVTIIGLEVVESMMRVIGGATAQLSAEIADMLGILLRLVAAVSWCVWFRRANRALRARSMQLGYGPNAWGWFFVPLAMWILPYWAVEELYVRARDVVLTPALLRWWWGLWLLGPLVGPQFWEQPPFSVTRQVASSLLLAAAAWCAQRIVRESSAALTRPHAAQADKPASASLTANFA